MMISSVAQMVIVFVAALALMPFVPAVDAGDGIRVRTTTSPHLYIYALASLHLIPIAWSVGRGAGTARGRVNIRPTVPPPWSSC
jgi:hypothetical protein